MVFVSSKERIPLGTDRITPDEVVMVAKERVPVFLDDGVLDKVKKGREFLENLIASGKRVYGVNTGFGELQNVTISGEKLRELQTNLIYSHSCGQGEPLPAEIVRGMMFILANSLAKGYSAVRPDIVILLSEMLNREIHPVVPSQGSVGASGDLVPLSHMALVLLGEGKAEVDGKVLPGKDALLSRGLSPLKLGPKEGLSLINGTHFMTSFLCVCLYDAELLLESSVVASAMSLEALLGTDSSFDEALHKLRPFTGQLSVAKAMRELLSGSEILLSHKECPKVQDQYSLRCIPQVLGAVSDVLKFVKNVATTEINSVTDNPVCLGEEDRVLSGGNFHGEPLAFALDFLAIAVSEIASFSERRIYRLLEGKDKPLPRFLTLKPGVNSGLMVLQYLAASLVSENKVLSHPASVDSIPTSAGMEDHVSMGSVAAVKARRVVENAFKVLATELVCASQALKFHESLKPGKGARVALEKVRSHVAFVENDRALSGDVEKISEMIKKGEFSLKACLGEDVKVEIGVFEDG